MIYYVEDDDNIRELVVYTLNQVGLEARGYSCARDFYGAMEQQAPDLVLLDIMLPEEDGLTILRRLRAEAATEEIPVVMITAKTRSLTRCRVWIWVRTITSPSPSAWRSWWRGCARGCAVAG